MIFTDEQRQLGAEVRRFLRDSSPTAEVRRLMETESGYDPRVWATMAGQLGLQGLAIPERFGGAGCGAAELVVTLEEMGRALLCAPYLGSAVLAARAVLAVGAEEFLPGIADGTTVATVALAEDDRGWSVDGLRTVAVPDRDTWVLTGHKTYVLDGHTADLLLVVAAEESGPSLFAVAADAPGLIRRPLQTIDLTRKQAALSLDGVPARRLGPARAAMESALRSAIIALAAEQVGGAQRCLDMSVEYAKLRVQFGRPIGSFQAIKHRCADMLLSIERARSAVYHAAQAADQEADELLTVASLAKALCSEVYLQVAADTIQIHGGIGFTWEHDAHLYFRRAQSTQAMFGSPDYHRELVATQLLG